MRPGLVPLRYLTGEDRSRQDNSGNERVSIRCDLEYGQIGNDVCDQDWQGRTGQED